MNRISHWVDGKVYERGLLGARASFGIRLLGEQASSVDLASCR